MTEHYSPCSRRISTLHPTKLPQDCEESAWFSGQSNWILTAPRPASSAHTCFSQLVTGVSSCHLPPLKSRPVYQHFFILTSEVTPDSVCRPAPTHCFLRSSPALYLLNLDGKSDQSRILWQRRILSGCASEISYHPALFTLWSVQEILSVTSIFPSLSVPQVLGIEPRTSRVLEKYSPRDPTAPGLRLCF